MSESKDAHYLVALVVISAEDRKLLRPGSRCVVKTGVGGYRVGYGVNGKAKK